MPGRGRERMNARLGKTTPAIDRFTGAGCDGNAIVPGLSE